jgi:anti-sigma B factor antagonist
MNFSCAITHAGDTAFATTHGDIDLTAAHQLRRSLRTIVQDDAIRRIVVDMAGVTFMDSAVLGVLIATRTAAERRGATLTVANPGPMVSMVLTLTGLFDVLVAPRRDRRRQQRSPRLPRRRTTHRTVIDGSFPARQS